MRWYRCVETLMSRWRSTLSEYLLPKHLPCNWRGLMWTTSLMRTRFNRFNPNKLERTRLIRCSKKRIQLTVKDLHIYFTSFTLFAPLRRARDKSCWRLYFASMNYFDATNANDIFSVSKAVISSSRGRFLLEFRCAFFPCCSRTNKTKAFVCLIQKYLRT